MPKQEVSKQVLARYAQRLSELELPVSIKDHIPELLDRIFVQGLNLNLLASVYSQTPEELLFLFQQAGIELPQIKTNKKKNELSSQQLLLIRARYKAGDRINRIAKDYGISQFLILKIVREGGDDVRRKGRPRKRD